MVLGSIPLENTVIYYAVSVSHCKLDCMRCYVEVFSVETNHQEVLSVTADIKLTTDKYSLV